MKKIYVDIANTRRKRAAGLMGRRRMPKNNGMLFVFDSKAYQPFWMYNTYLPLEIAFINDKGRIFQISEMSPHNTSSIKSNAPCKYALEVNKGWFKDNGIQVGAQISGQISGQGVTFDPNQMEGMGEVENQFMPEMQQQTLAPDVELNKSNRQILEEASDNEEFIMMYETQSGNVLPPRVIVAPFEIKTPKREIGNLEKDMGDYVVAWDSQVGDTRNFKIDRIVSLEKKGNPEDIQNITE